MFKNFGTNVILPLLVYILKVFSQQASEVPNFRSFDLYEYYWPTERNDIVQNYDEAVSKCRKIGASLAVVKTKDVGDFLTNQIKISSKCQYFKYF